MTESKESHEQLLKMIKSTSRRIILVQSAIDHENQNVIKLVKEADSDLSRTTIVFNDLHRQIRQFNSTQEINRYFSSTSGFETKTFHTTSLRPKLTSMFNGTEEFRKRVWQSQKRDLQVLEMLQFDRSYENSVGLHPLRKFVIKNAWKRFQDDVPVILDNLRDQMSHARRTSEDLENKLNSFSSSHLRGLANTFVLEFLQIIDSLIAGNSEGNPTVNGQTLLEEDYGHGYGRWKNSEEHDGEKIFIFNFIFIFIFLVLFLFYFNFYFHINFIFVYFYFFVYFCFYLFLFHINFLFFFFYFSFS